MPDRDLNPDVQALEGNTQFEGDVEASACEAEAHIYARAPHRFSCLSHHSLHPSMTCRLTSKVYMCFKQSIPTDCSLLSSTLRCAQHISARGFMIALQNCNGIHVDLSDT